jgi:hypothetical protein
MSEMRNKMRHVNWRAVTAVSVIFLATWAGTTWAGLADGYAWWAAAGLWPLLVAAAAGLGLMLGALLAWIENGDR